MMIFPRIIRLQNNSLIDHKWNKTRIMHSKAPRFDCGKFCKAEKLTNDIIIQAIVMQTSPAQRSLNELCLNVLSTAPTSPVEH